jgi:hypothetical protein
VFLISQLDCSSIFFTIKNHIATCTPVVFVAGLNTDASAEHWHVVA